MLAYAVIGLVVLAGVWTGATRMAARSWCPLGTVFAILLAGAGACWLIGAMDHGTALSGLMGTLMALLLCLAAGSVGFGALLRGLHDATRRRLPADPVRPMARPWDIWGLCALTMLAILASLTL